MKKNTPYVEFKYHSKEDIFIITQKEWRDDILLIDGEVTMSFHATSARRLIEDLYIYENQGDFIFYIENLVIVDKFSNEFLEEFILNMYKAGYFSGRSMI